VRILHLYRPQLPSSRAQSIQVFRTCHALAQRGHEVTLLANRGAQPEEIWSTMGLPPHPNFKLKLAPVHHPGLAGVWFRYQLKMWWKGEPGTVFARDKRRLLAAVHRHGKAPHRLVLETHGLESLLERDGAAFHAEEQQCLSLVDALVANCQGTLDAWREHHPVTLPSLVSHNASHHRYTADTPIEDVALVLGSMRSNKGVRALLSATVDTDIPLRWIGGTNAERDAQPQVNGVELLPPISHAQTELPVQSARVLIAPLGDNTFSHQLTSPLKLWDYLSSDRPIVTARTAATEEIASMTGVKFYFYEPDDVTSIQAALALAWGSGPRQPFNRSWDTRARELESVLSSTPQAPDA